jgi:hypothetical protein
VLAVSRQLFKRVAGAIGIVLVVWLGVAAPDASIDFLALHSDLTDMSGCGTARELQSAASGLLYRVGQTNPQQVLAKLHSRDPEMRASFARVAARNGTPGSLEPILALTHDPELKVRRCALRAVSSYRDPRIVPLLIRALDDPDRWCQLSAYTGLKSLDDPAGLAAADAWYPHWLHGRR